MTNARYISMLHFKVHNKQLNNFAIQYNSKKKFATYFDKPKILGSFSATFLMFKNFVNMA